MKSMMNEAEIGYRLRAANTVSMIEEEPSLPSGASTGGHMAVTRILPDLPKEQIVLPNHRSAYLVLIMLSVILVILGVYPTPIIQLIQRAVTGFA